MHFFFIKARHALYDWNQARSMTPQFFFTVFNSGSIALEKYSHLTWKLRNH